MFKDISKVELHDHLDGGLRVETVFDLLQKNPQVASKFSNLDSLKKVQNWFSASGDSGEKRKSLKLFLENFDLTIALMQTKEALFRVAYEAVEDAKAMNIIYSEFRFAPFLHTFGGLSLNEVVEAVISGLEEGENVTGVKTGLILCGLRSEKSVLETAKLCLDYEGRGVCGFDLAGDEAGFPVELHKDSFDFLTKRGYKNITCHAGEAAGADSIRNALDLGAIRIGHSVAAINDLELMNYLQKNRIHLECCITSNLVTGAVDKLVNHPSLDFYKKGILLSFCTDDRLMCDTNMQEEYSLVKKLFKEDYKQVLKVSNMLAIENAFGLTALEKESLKQKIVV